MSIWEHCGQQMDGLFFRNVQVGTMMDGAPIVQPGPTFYSCGVCGHDVYVKVTSEEFTGGSLEDE